jgi:hypothetical protein
MAFKMNPKSPLLRSTGNFPQNQEVTMKADGSGGTVKLPSSPAKYSGNSPFKQTNKKVTIEVGGESGIVEGSAGALLTKDQKKDQKDLHNMKMDGLKDDKKSKIKKINQSNKAPKERRAAKNKVRKTARINKNLEKHSYDIVKGGDYTKKSDRYNIEAGGTGGSKVGNFLRDVVGTRAKDAGRKTVAGKIIKNIKDNVLTRDPQKKKARLKKVAEGGGSQVGDAGRRLKKNIVEIFVGSKEAGTSRGSKTWGGKSDYRKNEEVRYTDGTSKMRTGAARRTPAKSFGSLVSKLMKEGKSKEAATKIAGSVANAKMKGAGSGPTAKQKARAK